MDRVSLISSWLLDQEKVRGEDDEELRDPDDITQQSNLQSMPPRSFHIVTTAALPWYTGTAINPLLRAAYLYQTLTEREQLYQKLQLQQQRNGTNHGAVATQFPHANKSTVSVTLTIPWLELEEDQEFLYHTTFSSQQDQEAYIRDWLTTQANLSNWVAQGITILFYPARYHYDLKSIFAMGDLIKQVILRHNKTELDVCILEEPEHCNWFRAPGDGWTQQFQYVVGIIHTNYKEYAASSHYSGLWTAPALAMICSAMVRAYCHRVIKLSDALQVFSPGKEVTCNVHGVRDEFWRQGLELAKLSHTHNSNKTEELDLLQEPRVYFLGKLLWAKGLDLLLELQEYYKKCIGSYFEVDIYGSGPDSDAIQRAFAKSDYTMSTATWSLSTAIPSLAILVPTSSMLQSLIAVGSSMNILAKQHWSNLKNSLPVKIPKMAFMPQLLLPNQKPPIPAHFLGRVDHAQLPHNYTIFVNPSVSEVLCTATAEALSSGRFAIIPLIPSNRWFLQFPNCLPYRNKLEFVANLRWALNHDPVPLTPEQARQFSWQAATGRLFDAAAMTHRESAAALGVGSRLQGERITWLHNEVLGKGPRGDLIRKLLGAGPVSHQVLYQAEKDEEGEETNQRLIEEEEDEGLGKGFSRSWFVTAIRTTWIDLAKSFGTTLN